MAEQRLSWFPAKAFGWGWGLPRVWQGWLVLAIYGVLLTLSLILLSPGRFRIAMAILSLLLLAVCGWKGEKPG